MNGSIQDVNTSSEVINNAVDKKHKKGKRDRRSISKGQPVCNQFSYSSFNNLLINI